MEKGHEPPSMGPGLGETFLLLKLESSGLSSRPGEVLREVPEVAGAAAGELAVERAGL
jgi:hypothetical protein